MSASSASGIGCPCDRQIEEYIACAGKNGAQSPTPPAAGLSEHLERCATCRRRLTAIRRDNALMAAIANAHAEGGPAYGEAERGAGSEAAPVSIPGYEVLSEIRRGSQGVVYKAIQKATKRTVALKVLLAGSSASVRQRQRFEREIDLAAGLQHPHIVTIYDSGVTPGGERYFAMEYIDGVSLDEHMRSMHDARPPDDPQSINATLRLFAKICDAVHYAHQRGVIHRDLKPSNIRVDAGGEPHVLDFGLAKVLVLDPDEAAKASLVTLSGEFTGTLAYASPEQTKGNPRLIDVRTDVYALGVILYEMLTGRLPYKVTGSMAEVLKSIAEAHPEPPSTWYTRADVDAVGSSYSAYKINDEIETIVLKVLAKEKSRRYQSAGELQQDIGRYLAGEPIEAKRDSSWYVFQKTVRRHKGPVSVAALIALMITAFVVDTFQDRRALAQELDETNVFLSQLVAFIEHIDPVKGTGANPDMVGWLDAQSRRLDDSPPRYRRHEVMQRTAIGRAYKEYRELDKAQRELTMAVRLARETFDEPHPDLAGALNNLGDVYWFQGQYAKVEPLYRESLDIRQNYFPDDKEALAEGLNDMAALLLRQGDLTGAEGLFRKALAMRRQVLGKHFMVGASLNNLATCLTAQGRYEEAATLYREALALLDELEMGGGPKSARFMTALGGCLTELGEYEEAADVLDRAMAIKRARLGPASVAVTLHYLAALHLARGETDAAERLCLEGLRSREAFLGLEHPAVADSLLLLGRIHMAGERPEDAEAPIRRARAILRESMGENHYQTAEAASVLGECLAAQGRFEEAEPLP